MFSSAYPLHLPLPAHENGLPVNEKRISAHNPQNTLIFSYLSSVFLRMLFLKIYGFLRKVNTNRVALLCHTDLYRITRDEWRNPKIQCNRVRKELKSTKS